MQSLDRDTKKDTIFLIGYLFTLWTNLLAIVKLQKQAEVLLNADDLDTMWVLLRENCSIDEASGTEKVRFTSHYSRLFH